jgi:hypothetical protein
MEEKKNPKTRRTVEKSQTVECKLAINSIVLAPELERTIQNVLAHTIVPALPFIVYKLFD